MTQFQWIFSIIPDAILNWVYWGIIAVGIAGMFAGWFGKFIPVYGRYIEYIKPVGIVLVVLGVWLRGGYDTEMVWRAKVAEAEAKVAKAEEISKDANKKLETVRAQKQKVRVEYYATVKERIKEVAVQMDTECKLDPIVPKLHNDAAKNPTPKGTVTIEEVKK